MKGGLRLSIAGLFTLLALAGCGRSWLQYGERASWRHEAEVNCLKSGSVKIGTGVVQISPIEGPGMCGADFPLKVSALGGSSLVGYTDEVRPPGAIPNGDPAQMPRWPVNEPRYSAPVQPVQTQPMQPPVQTQTVNGQRMQWVRGPQGIEAPAVSAPGSQPVSLSSPGLPRADDIPDDAVLPQERRAAPPYQQAYPQQQPAYRPPAQRVLPALGPVRGPSTTGAILPATVTPTATLACPLVSTLDRWVNEGVQPAAMRWFGAQVVEIKQISAYSCRQMVGAGGNYMSEHAYGNALDVAGFILADGRKVTVKDGWHGTPEEQGFMHDIQLSACEMFSTVLGPGYNVYHYDHIHMDLMRRGDGRHPCRPTAIPGEVAAAKARSLYASKHHGPAYTGSIRPQPVARGPYSPAVAGEDGFVPDDDGDPSATGSIVRKPVKPAAPDADEDVEVAVPVGRANSSAAAAGEYVIRAEERKSAFH